MLAVPRRARTVLDLDESPSRDIGPAPYPARDDADEAAYATYARALLDERREAMEPDRLTWTQNLLFLSGLQWWRYDGRIGAFTAPRGASWRQRPVRNLLLPYFRFVMAKLTKNRPRTTCVPASTDPDDIHAAKLGDEVLKAKWIELRLTRVLRRAIAWLIPTGNAYLMPHWNQDSGLLAPLTTLVQAVRYDAVTHQPDGIQTVECPCDESGNPILDEHGLYDLDAVPHHYDMGDVGLKVLSPFQVFVEPDAAGDDDVHSVVVVEAITLREIYRRWPHASGITAEDTSEIDRFDNLIVSVAAGADTHLAGAQYQWHRESQIPKALVLYYFERPSERYPHGRYWVSASERLLEDPGPLPDGIWPVVIHILDVERPGSYLGDATMTAAVGLQREYNEVNAQIKEHHNLMLRGKWLVPIGSNIRRGQITQAPGEVIQHTPGLKPEMADLRPLPQKVYDEREQVLQDFQFISGVHKVSMGSPPPGVTSGRAFLTLQEADDSDLGPLLEGLEEAVAELSWAILQIIQRNYDEERLVRVSGDDRRYQVHAFRGADLASIVDVEPQSGTAFPWSKTAKQSMMIDLVQAVPQLFVDPETGMFDHERFRRLLPVGGEEAVGHGSDFDVAEALREEETYQQWDGASPLPEPMPWQNHAIHLRQHGRILKSESFQRWPPEAREQFIAHWQATQIALDVQSIPALPATEDASGSLPPETGPAAPALEQGVPPGQGPVLHQTEAAPSVGE